MNAIPLTKANYDGAYIMYEDGTILNTETQKILKEDKQGRVTIYRYGKAIHKSVRVLYKELFNRYLQRQDYITDIEGEEWKEVQDSHGQYLVSNMGRIKTYSKHSTARLLKPFKRSDKQLYLSLDLYVSGKRETVLVSRLVAKHFVEGYSEEKQIHHKDGNPQNNAAFNLMAVTEEEHLKLHNKKAKQQENEKKGAAANDKEVLSSVCDCG